MRQQGLMPAFASPPVFFPTGTQASQGTDGMSIRTALAAQIAQGDWANSSAGVFHDQATTEDLRTRSALYVRAADALIEELLKNGGTL